MENPDHALSVAAAIFAFGTGIGEIYLQSRTVEYRRFGRAVKVAATLGAGLFALQSAIDLKGLTTRGTVGVAVVAAALILYIVAMMYRLESRGVLKEPE